MKGDLVLLNNKSSYFKRLTSVFLVITMVTIFGVINAQAGKITLKFDHQNNIFDADPLLAETFKALVEEKTDGAIEITIYLGTLTTSVEEGFEFLRLGTVDIQATSGGHIAGYYPDIQFLQLPYIPFP
jgi:TRAP-type C4-dicarboxylate transport system substrate-binding protein